MTIDEKEYLHLGCLLEELFPEARIQMISSVISPRGAMRKDMFTRVEEYIYYVLLAHLQLYLSALICFNLLTTRKSI